MTTLQKQKLYHRRAKEKPLIANLKKLYFSRRVHKEPYYNTTSINFTFSATPTKSRPHLALK